MRKRDIVAHAAEWVSLSEARAEDAMNALLDAIRGALANGEKVSLPGFSTFSARSLTAGAENETTRAPVFVSGSLSSAASNATTLMAKNND